MPVASAERICARCGHVGFPQLARRGSPLLGSSLWMLTFVVYVGATFHWSIGLLAVLCLLVAAGYSIWRFVGSARVCGQCGAPHTIQVSTPEGRQVREKHQQAARRRGGRRAPP